MKQDFAFAAERPLASHSPALIRPGPADADVVQALRQAAARLKRSLRGALARLCGGEPPDVAISAPYEVAFGEFAYEGLCAYSVYHAAPSGERLMSAIDADAILRLVDRAFGGPGEPPRPSLRDLPMSGDLMVQRIETILAAELGAALGTTPSARAVIHPLRRDTDLAQLQAYPSATRLMVLDIAVSEGTRAPWPIRMAMPRSALPVLTGMTAQPLQAARETVAAEPDSEPFATVPLTLTALLIDTRLPLQVVSRLEAGQVLNLPMARQVPLIVGRHGVGRAPARSIAQGTIGAIDDRVAIQITRLA